MTTEEARALLCGTEVYYGRDPNDRGVVVENSDDVVKIQWRGDVNASAHAVTNLGRIHPWRRGLRAVES